MRASGGQRDNDLGPVGIRTGLDRPTQHTTSSDTKENETRVVASLVSRAAEDGPYLFFRKAPVLCISRKDLGLISLRNKYSSR